MSYLDIDLEWRISLMNRLEFRKKNKKKNKKKTTKQQKTKHVSHYKQGKEIILSIKSGSLSLISLCSSVV